MIIIDDLTFRMEGRLLFDAARAIVPEGHRVGLLGRNGTGKTTLFKLITGELAPEGGSVSVPKGRRIGHVAQEAPGGPVSLLETVLAADTERASLLARRETESDGIALAEIEHRLLEIDAHAAPSRAATILSGLGFSTEAQARPCSEFSGGWRMRVALAAVLFADPDILLLDEPTNYLDLEGTIWLESYLKTTRRTVLLISHDRDLLNSVAQSILHLEDRKLTLYTGRYDQFEETRAQRLALQEASRKKQEAARAHMQDFVDRFRYKASKARQAQSRLKALAKMAPIAAVIERRVAPFHLPSPQEIAPPLLALDDVSVGYAPGQPVLSHLDFRLDADDRIALLGANGNGKSTFAKLIADKLKAGTGRLSRAPKLKVGYFAQHQLDELRPEETPVWHLARLMPKATETDLRKRLGAFGFGIDLADTPCGKLSGGEKARLLIALAAFDAPHVLILDEPTNHLDIDSRAALAEALNDYSGAVILISHDRHLIDASVDRLWLVAGGRITAYDGDLDDYRRHVLSGGKAAAAPAPKPQLSPAEQRRLAAEKRAQVAPLKKAADQAEKLVTGLQAKLAGIEASLSDPAVYEGDGARGLALQQERGAVQRDLAAAEERWLAALEVYEAAKEAVEA
ncbi:MAG: ATP-binding cassette domain-containing protein [Alphaproteobacteria bacterium]|nr:ATP-binding cassette domain-containing protein [Alphaproteobacteria bacterium]